MAEPVRWLVGALMLVGCATGGDSMFEFGGSAPGPVTSADDPQSGTDSGGGTDDTGAADTIGGGSTAAGACGNALAEASEDCDGEDLSGQDCTSFGFDDGVLVCDMECRVSTDACFTCGDGTKSLAETCDSQDFGTESCEGLGFGGGTLACASDCLSVDTVGCTPLASCGDGTRNGTEQCDGADLGGASCQSVGFDTGSLACNAGACTYNTTGCQNSNCGESGDLCIPDDADPQSTCCPAGVGGNILGICSPIFVCV